jgi:hypothetical protein
LNEEPIIDVKAPGVMDVTVWRQEKSMTVHLVNLTNPMMLKGPFRELIPVDAEVKVKVPAGAKLGGVRLVLSDKKPKFKIHEGLVTLSVPQIADHEIVALDLI